jgi:hypothetical protein
MSSKIVHAWRARVIAMITTSQRHPRDNSALLRLTKLKLGLLQQQFLRASLIHWRSEDSTPPSNRTNDDSHRKKRNKSSRQKQHHEAPFLPCVSLTDCKVCQSLQAEGYSRQTHKLKTATTHGIQESGLLWMASIASFFIWLINYGSAKAMPFKKSRKLCPFKNR